MYDLHTHTVFSDGCLIPSELVQRYAAAGYHGVVLTDHIDASNMDIVIPQLVKFCSETNECWENISVLPGCELTHLPPETIASMIKKARSLGAKVVIVHGETIVEPVAAGTNCAAIEGGADILAHPGLINEEEMELAAQKGVYLEITSRHGHSFSNGHIVSLAQKYNAKLVYSSDCHSPADILSRDAVMRVLHGAGLGVAHANNVLGNTKDLFKHRL